MTADVVPLRRRSRSEYEDQVRASIRALMAGLDVGMEQLAEMTGFSMTTLYSRFAASGSRRAFSAGEVAVIAEAMGVPIEAIYSGRIDVSQLPETPTGALPLPTGSGRGGRRAA